jgi:heme b synthase
MGTNNELRIVFWELTARCNLKCIHCRAEATPISAEGELSTPEAFEFIEALSSFANPLLILTGGEPLYRQDIYDIAAYAVKKGLLVALATNGTLVDSSVAEKIKASGIRRVSISLDGARAVTHDSFRGVKGSFNQAIAGFRNLKEHGVSVQFNTTVAQHNRSEIEQLLDMARELKVDALHLFMLVPVGCGVKIVEDQMLSPGEYEKTLKWLYRSAQRFKDIDLKATCAPHYFRILKQISRKEGIPDGPPKTGRMSSLTKGCLAGSAVCFVSRIGDIQPCGYLPVIAGNVREQSIKDIWENSTVFQDLRDPDKLKGKCGRCDFKLVCGGCRARAYFQTGDYLEEEPFCSYQPRMKG